MMTMGRRMQMLARAGRKRDGPVAEVRPGPGWTRSSCARSASTRTGLRLETYRGGPRTHAGRVGT